MSEQTLTFRFTRDQLTYDESHKAPALHQITSGGRVMRDMRAAGVPLIGTLGIFGVEHGTLTMRIEDDLDGDVFVYTWIGVPLAPHLRKNNFTFAKTLAAVLKEEDEL